MDTVLPPDAGSPTSPPMPAGLAGEPSPPPPPPLAGAFTMAILGYPAGSVIGICLWVVGVALVRLLLPGVIPGHGARSAFTNPVAMLILLASSGIGSVAITLLATLASPRPRAEQLGWRRAGIDGGQWVFAFVAAAGVSLGGASTAILLQHLHVLKEIPDSSIVARLEAALRAAPLALGVALALASGVFPGISEELLFRGYILRRLLRRLSPPVAIVIAACAFSFWHWQPARVLATAPFALWIGYVAWRSDSVLPGIAIHAWNNAVLSLAGILTPHPAGAKPHMADGQVLALCAAGLALAAIGIAGFEWRRRGRVGETREPAGEVPPGPVT